MPPLTHHTDWVQLRHHTFADYPTTIRRSVFLGQGVVIDHSLHPWLYRRWLAHATIEQKLHALHKAMAQTLIQTLGSEPPAITFVHTAPRIPQHTKHRHDG